MATSGQVNTNTEYDSYFWVYWQEQSQDIASNKTQIYWSCGVYCGHTFRSNAIKMSPVSINGTQVYGGGTYSNFGVGEHRLDYGYLEIEHDDDGEKEFSISSFTGWLYQYHNYSSNGDSFDLTTIPRISKPTVSLDTLDFGEPVTISTNRKSTDFVHKLWYKYGTTGWIEITPTASVTDSYDWTVPENLMNQIPNSPSLDITIGCDTYYNGSYVGEDYAYITANVPETTIPTVSMDVSLNNSSLLSQFDGMYIQGKSRLDVSLSAEGKYGATITNIYVVIDEKKYNSAQFTSEAILSSGSVVGYAKDSRGFPNSASEEISVISYSKPLVVPVGSENAILCYRSDGNGKRIGNSTSIWIKAKRSFYSLSGKNLCALEWRSKLVTEIWNDSVHQWHDLLPKTEASTDEYNALILGEVFNLKKSYSIQIRAIDDIGEYDIKTFEIPTQDVALHLGAGGKNVSVGTYCDYSKEHTFYSEWDAYFDKDVYIKGTPISNHIIEEGFQECMVRDTDGNPLTDGIWTYRKWSNGYAECRGVFVQNDVAVNVPWGVGLFESKGYAVDLPSGLFVETPQFDITLDASGGTFLQTYSLGSTLKTPHMCAVRPEGTTTVAILNTSISAYGRWK